jgi:hypothetical protein
MELALNAKVEIRDWHDGFASRYLLVLIEPNGKERKLVHCADKKNAIWAKELDELDEYLFLTR